MGFLLSLINPLRPIMGELKDLYLKRQNAETEQMRIEAEVKIAQLEARRDSLLATPRMSAFVQFCWAAPFIAYNAKIIVWDKMLGWGVTDPLGPFETNLGYMIAGFYFLTVSAKSLFRR